MSWSKVGDFLKSNADKGASLIGSLLTGNVLGAVSAGASMVMSATGQETPELALEELKANPEAMVKLRELQYKNEADIRKHLEQMTLMSLQDKQKEHDTTSKVIVEGQLVAEKGFEKLSRPSMAWVSLLASIAYSFYAIMNDKEVDILVLTILSGGYFAWMGLRTIDKRNKVNEALKPKP